MSMTRSTIVRYPYLLSAINMQYDLTKDRLFIRMLQFVSCSAHRPSDLLICEVVWTFSLHHVTSHTRLSPFTACNIENMGGAEDEANGVVQILQSIE